MPEQWVVLKNFSNMEEEVKSFKPGFLRGREFFFPYWSYLLIRILLSGLFLWSGFAKLADLNGFAILIEAFGIVPEYMTFLTASGLALLEVTAGFALIFDVRGSLAVITGLLLIFMAVLTYGIAMGFDIDCGCFGPGDPEFGVFQGLESALLRDSAFLAGVFYLYAFRRIRSHLPIPIKPIISSIRFKRRNI